MNRQEKQTDTLCVIWMYDILTGLDFVSNVRSKISIKVNINATTSIFSLSNENRQILRNPQSNT